MSAARFAIFHGAGRSFEFAESPLPACAAGEVLVAISLQRFAARICTPPLAVAMNRLLASWAMRRWGAWSLSVPDATQHSWGNA